MTMIWWYDDMMTIIWRSYDDDLMMLWRLFDDDMRFIRMRSDGTRGRLIIWEELQHFQGLAMLDHLDICWCDDDGMMMIWQCLMIWWWYIIIYDDQDVKGSCHHLGWSCNWKAIFIPKITRMVLNGYWSYHLILIPNTTSLNELDFIDFEINYVLQNIRNLSIGRKRIGNWFVQATLSFGPGTLLKVFIRKLRDYLGFFWNGWFCGNFSFLWWF